MRHLDEYQLLRALDDELTDFEAEAVEGHLAVCEECRANYCQMGAVSVRIEQYVASIPVSEPEASRRRALLERIQGQNDAVENKKASFLHWAGMALAVAAGLAAVLAVPVHHETRLSPLEPATQQTIQVNGEEFVALPYSNSELPVTASHIVPMEVPVASLADAGIVIEPVSNQVNNPNRSVKADVLIGMDGEPRGIHVPDGN